MSLREARSYLCKTVRALDLINTLVDLVSEQIELSTNHPSITNYRHNIKLACWNISVIITYICTKQCA